MSLLERVRPAARSAGPSWSGPTLSGRPTPAYLPGALAGLRAAGISFAVVTVPLLAAWALADHVTASWTQALRLAACGWLLLHHVAIAFPGGQVGLVPLALSLVPVLAAYRSARRLAAEPLLAQGCSPAGVSLRPAAQAVAGLAGGYAAVATLVALVAGTSAARPVLWQAPLGPALLAGAAGAAGILRGHPRGAALRAELAGRLPGPVRRALRPALVGAAVVLVSGLVAVVVAVGAHTDRVLTVHRSLAPGGFGGAVLVLGQLGYLPDLAGWATAWLAGPGFAVGSGTVVSAGHVHLGLLPAVPVLGALPSQALTPSWAVALPLVVPVLAGAVVGWRTARQAPADDLALVARLLDAVVAAVLTGLLLGVVVALSAGPIGPGRLAQVGANAVVVTPLLAMALAVGAMPAAALVTWRRRLSRRAAGPAAG